MNLVRLLNLLLQPLVGLGVLKIAADVIDLLGEPAPGLRVDRCGSILGNLFAQHLAETFRGVVVRGEAHNRELLGKEIIQGQIAQRRDQFSFRQVAARTKYDHHAGRWGGIRIRRIQIHEWTFCPHACDGFGNSYRPDFFSTCPPNWKRIADKTFPAKSSSPRDVNRWNNDAVRTGAGAVDSTAARIVQRPSPESDTRPEKRSSVGCSSREMAVRSSSHEATTLPRRQTSVMSARLKSY